LYTTDSREMSDDSAQKLSRLRLAGKCNPMLDPLFLLLVNQARKSGLSFDYSNDMPGVAGSQTYSTLAESPPAVELETDMLGSTAIISARMSRMGWKVNVSNAITPFEFLLATYLGHSLVVDGDKLSGLRVDLEGLVEAQRGVNRVGAVLAHALALRNLLHEVALGLLRVAGEAILVGLDDGLLDPLLLALLGGLALLLLGLLHLLVLLLQRLAELGV
jgi:hypothetical protein